MNEERVVNISESPDESEDSSQTRQRSTIGFPYMSLADAIEVAQSIHTNVGHGDCSIQQLSAWMKQSPKSSGFRIQLAAARMFGVIESEGTNNYRLANIGLRIVDPSNLRKAKVDAFLNVPLFRALFEKHKDGVLPPSAALEREIAGLGVAEKQKTRARQTFEGSAELAGFFEHGKNKLVVPAVVSKDDPPPPAPTPSHGGDGGGNDPNALSLDPLLMALLRKIPPAEEGWPEEKRLRWFRTFAMNVSQVYDNDAEPVEFKIDKV